MTASRTDLIETRVIDGQEYILIPVTDNVEVNGIRIRTGVGNGEKNTKNDYLNRYEAQAVI